MKKEILSIISILLFFTAISQNKTDFKTFASTPPMGWNSYDAYYGTIIESQFKNEVDVLAKKVLPHGYEYAIVDYCWFNRGPKGWNPDNWITFDVDHPYKSFGNDFNGMAMDKYGRLLPAENRFPSASGGQGFKALAAYTHAKGMKFGIHVMRGIAREAVQKNTPVMGTKYFAKDIVSVNDSCVWNESMYGVDATKPGAQEYYNSLLNLYAYWGVDFIKVDDILSPVYHVGEIDLIRHAIDQCGRKIVLSLSPGDALLGFANHVDNTANMYRMSNDVWDRWRDILHVFDLANAWSPFIGNGTWPDADMIPFGKLCLTGYPYEHNKPNDTHGEHFSRLNYNEQKTFISLWCMARSPLMWGGSAIYSSDSTFSLLTNDAILAINKSSINNHQLYQPDQRSDNKDYRIWVAESADKKTKYVAFFNLKDQPADIVFKLDWEFWKGYSKSLELWTKQTIPIVNNEFTTLAVQPHGVAIYKLIQ
jgi:hypothetical protein